MGLEFDLVLIGAGKKRLGLLGMNGELLAGEGVEVVVPFEAEVVLVVAGSDDIILFDVTAPLGEDEGGRDGVEGQQLAEGAFAKRGEEEEDKVAGKFVPSGVGRSKEGSGAGALAVPIVVLMVFARVIAVVLVLVLEIDFEQRRGRDGEFTREEIEGILNVQGLEEGGINLVDDTIDGVDITLGYNRIVVQGDLPRREQGALHFDASAVAAEGAIIGVEFGSECRVLAKTRVFDDLGKDVIPEGVLQVMLATVVLVIATKSDVVGQDLFNGFVVGCEECETQLLILEELDEVFILINEMHELAELIAALEYIVDALLVVEGTHEGLLRDGAVAREPCDGLDDGGCPAR